MPRPLALALAFSSALAACGHSAPSSPSSPSSPSPSSTGGGVRGTVTELTGDYMPPAPPAIPTPVAASHVYVFAAPHPMIETAAQVDPADPAYRGTAITDAEGRFELALPPGRYQVVAEVEGHLIASCVADGTWCPLEVGADWLTVRINDTSRATF